jgi:hypothetical protein
MTDTPPKNEEDISFELGDRILISGGRHHKLRGRIYYIDEESLIRILPDGVSDRLIDIAIIDGDFDPELKIDQAYLVSKRTKPAFVTQIDATIGDKAETFNKDGEPDTIYTIEEVNEKEDTLLLKDESGSDLLVECNFKGIPLDEHFEVIRIRRVDDELDSDVNQEGEETQGEEEDEETFDDVFDDILNDEIKADNVFRIQEIPSANRSYPDDVQINDMIQDFLLTLDAVDQKNPREHKKLRIFVEQCMNLRNSLIIYSNNGDPIGTRPTSYSTLNDLIENVNDIPLSRHVLNAKRILFLDSSDDMAENTTAYKGVLVKYLNSVLNETVNFMDSQLGGVQSIQIAKDDLPNWFVSWNTLNQKYGSTWVSENDDDTIQFKRDTEFFRGEPSVEDDNIDGLPVLRADRETPVTSDLVSKISMSMLRGLGPRSTRLKKKDMNERRVESAEEGELTGTLLFPLSEEKNIGATRSGILAYDIARSHENSETMKRIIERLEGVSEEPLAGKIMSLGGLSVNGNITLEEWLHTLPIYPFGLGDIPKWLRNYGLTQNEYNVDQQDVFIEKINTMHALLKQYITDVREASNKASSEHVIEPNPFISDESYDSLMEILQTEPILTNYISDMQKITPLYKDSDIATIAYLLNTTQELLIKAVAQIPNSLAVERNRKVREQFLDTLNAAITKEKIRKNSGEIPVRNKCAHVKSLNSIYKVKDIDMRMQLFAKFIVKFQGERNENWIECAACSQHLICYHEFLLLHEYLHPREKDTIHKELIIKFNGERFNGKHTCNNCGQIISDFDYDTSIEYTDEGVPMSGRAVLEDDSDAVNYTDILLESSDMTSKETSIVKTVIYTSAVKIFDMVGIRVNEDVYKIIVDRVESEINKIPPRDKYPTKSADGKKLLDYDKYINRILVCFTAINCLLEIQTNIPGYTMRYKMPGCTAGFSGYPLGDEKELVGMKYIACAVARVSEPIPPWSLTGFQTQPEKTREDAILSLMKSLMTSSLLTNSSAQHQITLKKAYLKDVFGTVSFSDQLSEQIPSRFSPVLVNLNNKDEVKEVIVSRGASPTQVARAWILESHKYGKENGNYTNDSLFLETTCCISQIQYPNNFWSDKKSSMTSLEVKSPPRGPVGSHLSFPFSPRRNSMLEGTISPEVMYKIFLNICYDGPRKGLPHSPGYTNMCTYCGFTYAESPYSLSPFPPISIDSKMQKELTKAYNEEIAAIVTKGKLAIDAQNIKVDVDTFEEILDSSHKAFKVDPKLVKKPVTGLELLKQFSEMDPEPFNGWKRIMNETINILNVENGSYHNLYDNISREVDDIFEKVGEHFTEDKVNVFKNILKGSSIKCIESINTYFIVPMYRIICGFKTDTLRVHDTYNLSPETLDDIYNFMNVHLKYLSDLQKRKNTYIIQKLKWTHSRLIDAHKILKESLRAPYIPGGNTGLQYIISALFGGIMSEFIDSNIVPPGMNESVEDSLDSRGALQIMNVLLDRIIVEGMNFTDEQIRQRIIERETKEKMLFINRFDVLTPEARKLELMIKRIGLNEWAVGGTKAIFQYDVDQYLIERNERVSMGFGEGEGGYDNSQMAAEDY